GFDLILDDLCSYSSCLILGANRLCPGCGCDSPRLRRSRHRGRLPSLPVRSDGWSRQQSPDVYRSRYSSCSDFSISALASSASILSVSNCDSRQFVPALHSMMFVLLGKNLLSRSPASKGLFQGFEKESILRKALVLLTSYKTSFNVLQSSTYLYPAEQVAVVDSRPVRQLPLVSSVDEARDKLVAGLQGYKDQGLFSV